uniref:Putative secreted protein n=1 Tax=Anopheles marajoara TaxID=58244 RepID=A0A2M4C8G7_9DIPT
MENRTRGAAAAAFALIQVASSTATLPPRNDVTRLDIIVLRNGTVGIAYLRRYDAPSMSSICHSLRLVSHPMVSPDRNGLHSIQTRRDAILMMCFVFPDEYPSRDG